MRHYQPAAQAAAGNPVAFNEPPPSLGPPKQMSQMTMTKPPPMHVQQQQHGPPIGQVQSQENQSQHAIVSSHLVGPPPQPQRRKEFRKFKQNFVLAPTSQQPTPSGQLAASPPDVGIYSKSGSHKNSQVRSSQPPQQIQQQQQASVETTPSNVSTQQHRVNIGYSIDRVPASPSNDIERVPASPLPLPQPSADSHARNHARGHASFPVSSSQPSQPSQPATNVSICRGCLCVEQSQVGMTTNKIYLRLLNNASLFSSV